MTNIAEMERVVTGGVDTHKDNHVAAALDQVGRVLGTQSFPATAAGYRELHEWLASFGTLDRVGIEGTGSYGKNLTRHLIDAGASVCEVIRPSRAQRRRHGKSDPADAISAAKAVLAGDAEIFPKVDGPAEQIRMIRMCRNSFIKTRTVTANQIHSIIDTAPETIRAELIGTSMTAICRTIATWTVADATATIDDTTRFTLIALAAHWTHLSIEIKRFERQRDALVTAAAPPQLLAKCGVGTDVAAAIMIAAGANPERVHSDAAFAALGGTSPVDASTGRRDGRHRLNRGGNRDLNNAIWRIVIVRLRFDPATKAYMQRRLAQGQTKRRIIRCLKRYVAREIWKTLQPPQQLSIAA